MGIDSLGLELLPVGVFATEARLAAESVKPATFRRYVDEADRRNWADCYDRNYALRHIPITNGAFPGETERAIAGYRAFCDVGIRNSRVRRLFELACLSVLESVSYTRKDGQYLRWDHRACRRHGSPHRRRGPGRLGDRWRGRTAVLARLSAPHRRGPNQFEF